jgi:hypothetical protein
MVAILNLKEIEMDIYIGTKMIEAEKMSKKTFEIEKYGKTDNTIEDMEGYKVRYSDNYVSWSPKIMFEKAYKKLNIESGLDLKTIKSDLITTDNTFIEHDNNTFNSPHNYIIRGIEGDILCGVHFQEGAIKETGLNGIFMEDLIAICINRLENFQNSDFRCRENACAITKLEESLMWLRKRTNNRQKRGVQGTYVK